MKIAGRRRGGGGGKSKQRGKKKPPVDNPYTWESFWAEPAVNEGIVSGLWRRARNTPWLAALFILTLLAPPEINLWVGTLRLSPYRIVLLVSFLPCLLSLVTGQSGRLIWVDLFIALHGLWAIVAYAYNHGAAQGLESGGIYFIECFGAYLLARRTIRDRESMRNVMSVVALSIFFFAIFAWYESITGHHVLREITRAAFGGGPLGTMDPRLGLERAFGTFEHPILYGVYCAVSLSFLFYAMPPMREDYKRLVRVAIVWIAAFFSVSAGPLAAMLVQLYVIIYELVTRMFRVSHRWLLFFGLLTLGYITVDILSNRGPVTVGLYYLTFSRSSAYNRLLIWEYGSAEAMRHPIFGIGFNDWTRPAWMSRSGSMDNFWLVCAVRFGLMGFITLAASMLTLIFLLAKQLYLTSAGRRIRMAWIITIFAFFLAGSTVHFWNALFAYYFFFMGMIVWLATEGDLDLSVDRRGLTPRQRAKLQLEEARRAQQLADELQRTRSLPGRDRES